MTTPRVYVACLAAYNNGKLHGEWTDATDADEIRECIKRVLATSPEPGAEEWAIHDYEGFGDIRLGENPDLDELAKLGDAIDSHGDLFTALHSHLNSSDVAATLAYLEENYAGEFTSLEDWAESFLDDTGALRECPESLRSYIDFEKWARDAALGGDIFTIELGYQAVHVFWNR